MENIFCKRYKTETSPSRERKHLFTNIYKALTFRFMRAWKKQNPDSYCHLQFDKLYIDNRLYVWDKESGEVGISCYCFWARSRTSCFWKKFALSCRWLNKRATWKGGRLAQALDLHQVFSGADMFLSLLVVEAQIYTFSAQA